MASDRAGRRGAPLREDKELAAELEALRGVSRLLGATEMAASHRNALERERRRLEAAVQARTRRSAGSHKPGEGEFDLGALFDELDGSTLIELVASTACCARSSSRTGECGSTPWAAFPSERSR